MLILLFNRITALCKEKNTIKCVGYNFATISCITLNYLRYHEGGYSKRRCYQGRLVLTTAVGSFSFLARILAMAIASLRVENVPTLTRKNCFCFDWTVSAG